MMQATPSEYLIFAKQLATLCRHISIREENNLQYILAIAHNDIFSLNIKCMLGQWVIEFWQQKDDDNEQFIRVLYFHDINEACTSAQQWLNQKLGK